MNLRSLLESIREDAGGPGEALHLTTFGKRLKNEGFDVHAQAGMKLTEFLGHFPEYCEIRGSYVQFLDGVPGDAGPSRGHGARRLQPDLWKAMTSGGGAQRWFLDLDSLAVVNASVIDGHPGPPVRDEPYRYLPVPTVGLDEQLAFVLEHVDASLAEQLRAAGDGWVSVAKSRLPPSAASRLFGLRKQWIIDRAEDWLRAHRINLSKFIRMERPDPRAGSAAGMPEAAIAGQLRSRLHDCVDAMTLPEMLELRLPARFLVSTTGYVPNRLP